MNTDIAEMIGLERERQGISQKSLARGLLSEKEYEAFQAGESLPNYYVIKCLAERLGIRKRRYTVYLGKEEFVKQNLVEQVYSDILMKRLVSAEKGLCTLEGTLQGNIYDKVSYARLKFFYENRIEKCDFVPDAEVRAFIEKIKEEIYENALLSMEELSLLVEYTVHTTKDIEGQKEALFDICRKFMYSGRTNIKTQL